jgi:hypothetical protein
MTALAMQKPAEPAPISPAQVKFREYHHHLANGDRELAERAWIDYITLLEEEMRRQGR